jgi:hypothetical protein
MVAANEITFDSVNEVMLSWYRIKQMPNYEETVGMNLFKKIIELVVLGRKGPSDLTFIGASSGDNLENPLFKLRASLFIRMLDIAINMLGPDLVPMTTALHELGGRHNDYGVEPGDYAVVGDALFHTLASVTGAKWSGKTEKSWKAVYAFISGCMITGGQMELEARDAKAKKHQAGTTKSKLGDDAMVNNMKNKKRGLMALVEQ